MKPYTYVGWSDTNQGLYQNEENEGSLFVIQESPRKNVYEVRKVYTFIDAISRIGSLYTSLTVFGAILVRFFSYRLLQSSLIDKIYHFRAKFDNELDKKKSLNQSKIKTVNKTKRTISKLPLRDSSKVSNLLNESADEFDVTYINTGMSEDDDKK